jgi:hypothetical protein
MAGKARRTTHRSRTGTKPQSDRTTETLQRLAADGHEVLEPKPGRLWILVDESLPTVRLHVAVPRELNEILLASTLRADVELRLRDAFLIEPHAVRRSSYP